MRTLALTLLTLVLVSPAWSVEATRYLAPRKDIATNGSALQETPSDVETFGDWRRSGLRNEETDGGDSPPAGSLRVLRRG